VMPFGLNNAPIFFRKNEINSKFLFFLWKTLSTI
jgi:hypothetical protein